MEQVSEQVEQTVKMSMENLNSLTGNLALDTIVSGVITFAVCFIVMRVIRTAVERSLKRVKRMDAPIRNLINKVVTAILWVLTVIIVAGAFGINATSLVAMLSVVGIAFSLAVKSLLTNLFSGILLMINKPFREGEFVELGDMLGTVKTIGFFSTIICTPDNITIVIPNGELTSAAVKNYSREPNRRVDLNFSTDYAAPTEAVKKAILEAVAVDSRILQDPAPFVRLLSYENSVIQYVVRAWCKNADYWDVYFNLNENVRTAFDANGIEMSYEHLNVHMMEK